MTRSMRMLIIFALAVVGLAGSYLWATWPQPRSATAQAPAPSAIGGNFNLIDQNGAVVTDESMRSQPFLVFFGFTHCPDICPTTLFEMSQALNALGDDAQKISVLFVTVDPERDTPETLKQYLGSFNNRIRGLTGSPEAVEEMVKVYRAYRKKVPLEGADYTMDHSSVVYIMDKEGRFVAPLNMKRTADEIAAELRRYL